jgi:hypothetical protein
MNVLGRGTKVFDAAPVAGTLRVMEGPDDVLTLMDTGAGGVIALVRDAGATFLAPLYHELAGIVCTSGTPRSHVAAAKPARSPTTPPPSANTGRPRSIPARPNAA